MKTFGFRLRFYLPACREFEGLRTKRRMHLETGSARVYLRRIARRRKKAGDPNEFIFFGEKFSTLESAQDFGIRLRLALVIFCAREGIGLNVGKDKATSMIGQHFRDMLNQKFNVQIRNDIHGLDVYCEYPPVKLFQTSATVSSHRVVEGHEKALGFLLENLPTLSEAQMLALELYNLTYFGMSSRARFLALVTVVEVLAQPASKSASARALVKRLQATVRTSKLSEQEKKELCEGLVRLKKDSISSACRKIISQLVNQTESRYFNACYKARSDLLHNGETKRTEPESPARLDALVRRLLLASIGIY